jgi:hypothetical protein
MKYLEIRNVDDLVRVIQVCVWGFVVFILMLVLGGIVGSMLYSVIWVSQPIKIMAPIDQAFTKMLNDIVLILASSVTTIVSMFAVNKGSQVLAEKIAPNLGIPPATPTPPAPTPAPQTSSSIMPNFNWMGFQNPELDETWRAPPPPTTPPDHIDPAREEIAMERAAAKDES